MKKFINFLAHSKSAWVAVILLLLVAFNPLGLGHAVIAIFAIVGAYTFFKYILPKWLNDSGNC